MQPRPKAQALWLRRAARHDGLLGQADQSCSSSCLEQAVLHYVIHAGLPFSTVENHYFLELMHLLRPNFKPPGDPLPNRDVSHRPSISPPLLPNKYAQLLGEVFRRLKEEEVGITLTLDGWSDRRMQSILAYNIVLASLRLTMLLTGR